MQRIYLIILLVTLHGVCRSECGLTDFQVWPNTKTISPNPLLVIEGYGISQIVIENLNLVNKIYLISGKDTVPLQVLRRYKGQVGLTQAVVQPVRLLKSGKQYELYFDYIDPENKAVFPTYKWKVRQHQDTEKPSWLIPPKYKYKSYVSFGCGGAAYVHFICKIKDKSETLVYTKVTNKKTNISFEYLLSPENKTLKLGHGMCGGAFHFNEGVNYEVQFGLLDVAGNEHMALTEPIAFTAPTPEDKPKTNRSLDFFGKKENVFFFSADKVFALHRKETGYSFLL